MFREYHEEIQLSLSDSSAASLSGEELSQGILFGIESLVDLRNQEQRRKKYLNNIIWYEL